jgi:hypothetical protein
LKTFIPVFFACLAGPVVQIVVSLAIRTFRSRADGAGDAGRTTDLILSAACVAALVVVCTTGTPTVWEIAFLFSFLWPVLLRVILRFTRQPAP